MAENSAMDIASLKILVAAIEEKSLSRASERVHVVTSAASKRITELERQLGTRLLRRHGRGVEPTPAGAMLYQQAKAILRTLDQVQTSLGAYSASGVPKIRLVVNSSAVQQFLSSEISSFSRKAPGSRRPDGGLQLRRAAHRGRWRGGLRRVPRGSSSLGGGFDAVPHRPLGTRGAIGPSTSRPETLRLEDALDYDFLGYFPRHSLEEFMQLMAPALPRPLRVRAQVSNPEARCELVREGLGLAILPLGIARNYEARMGLAVLPLEDEWAHRQLWACIRDRAALSPAAQEFLAQLLSGRG